MGLRPVTAVRDSFAEVYARIICTHVGSLGIVSLTKIKGISVGIVGKFWFRNYFFLSQAFAL